MEFFGLFTINPESFNVWSLRISMSLTTTIFIIGCTMAVRAFLHARGADLARLESIKESELLPQDGLSESVAKILWSNVAMGNGTSSLTTKPERVRVTIIQYNRL